MESAVGKLLKIPNFFPALVQLIFFVKFSKWKSDEHKKKSILRRISTKSKNFLLNKKKTLTEEDIEEMRERVEQV